MSEINRSHARQARSVEESYRQIRDKVVARGDLDHASVAEQLEILTQFSEFELGRFIIECSGADGYWTDYMVHHPAAGRKSGLNSEGKPFSPLEDFFLNRCPVVVAHQERFQIFQRLAQGLLKDNSTLASIPCGLMRDLLTLDYSKVSNARVIGVDIDAESLRGAADLAAANNVPNVELYQEDAWQLPFKEELDVILSSGLNVYEPCPDKVLLLYEQFYRALKPGGCLIISVLTHPPGSGLPTDWEISHFSSEELRLDRILHQDLLGVKWRNFRSALELDREFKQAGFSEVSVHFDRSRVFPTILASKK